MDYFIEAPSIRLALTLKAAWIFSLTISCASRRALLPPCVNLIIRSATSVALYIFSVFVLQRPVNAQTLIRLQTFLYREYGSDWLTSEGLIKFLKASRSENVIYNNKLVAPNAS